MKFGLFGGSFDPPHAAHVALARLACDHLGLDTLFVVPAGDPWQKTHRRLQPAIHRLAMVRLAFEGEPKVVVDPIEVERLGPSYSVDTLQVLQARQPGDWYLVIGQDQYSRLHTWHRWQDLLGRVTLAVAARDGAVPAAPPELAPVPHRCVVLPLPPMPVSSTALRTLLARGEVVTPLVPAQVARYIEQNHLYRS